MDTELLLDLKTINELKDMLDDGFLELFVVFKENSKANIDNLKSADEHNNIEDMRKYAHILKGSCGSLGLITIYNMMSGLEKSLDEEDSTKRNNVINELEPVYTATLRALIEHGFLLE